MIELLETEHDHLFDIRIDGYVHKRHKGMTEDAANACIKALRLYYTNIGERILVTRPLQVV